MVLLGALSDGPNPGVVAIAIITGLINTSNTFGALKGTDQLYERETSGNQYKRSFTISGVLAIISGLLGLVPYAPYVSSIGFLHQTRIRDRVPLVTGGLVPAVSNVLTTLPLKSGSLQFPPEYAECRYE